MHWIDYIIVLVSILAAIGMGMYFAHRQKDTSTYFAGGGKIPAWAVGISIFATLISSVTFLAYPGAAYADNWILLVQGLMVPVVLLALVGVIVPLFRKVIRLSTYEYFERRFGLFARLYSSFAFTLGHFSKAGTVRSLPTLRSFSHPTTAKKATRDEPGHGAASRNWCATGNALVSIACDELGIE